MLLRLTYLFLFVFSLIAHSGELMSTESIYQAEEKVVIYNWAEYIPEGLLEDFTKETGIQVEYSTFYDNDVLYSKMKILKGRGYDLIFPSTSLVNLMKEEGLIQPLNHKLLKNINNLSVDLTNLSYDPENRYSIPYLWGTTGIVIDKKKYPDEEFKSWGDLWHKKWRNSLVIQNDMREVFHMALKVNGHSTNTTNPDEIKLAYERLVRLLPNIKEFTDKPTDQLLSGEAAVGLAFSGDVQLALNENPEVSYIYPEEGTTIWIDSFAIPSRAKNVLNAHKFIDYMLRPEVAALSASYAGFATPNIGGKELLPKELRSSPIMFPESKVIERAQYQKNVGLVTASYELYWKKLKSYMQ